MPTLPFPPARHTRHSERSARGRVDGRLYDTGEFGFVRHSAVLKPHQLDQSERRCPAPRNRASDEPPGSPRRPRRRAVSTDFHVSPGASAIAPEHWLGHLPVRRWWASAHARTCFSVSFGGRVGLRTRRCPVSSFDSDEFPFRPRTPTRRALSRLNHVSSVASITRPEWTLGHSPVCWRCASAQARIWCFRQGRQAAVIPDSTARRQQLCQRRTTRKTAATMAQSQVYGLPCLARRVGNTSGLGNRPLAESLMMGIRPSQDLSK